MRNRLRQRWLSGSRFQLNVPPKQLQPWLQESGSLTQRLLNACDKTFSVRVLKQHVRLVQQNEAQLLRIPRNSQVIVREVHLLCGQIPWVYAHTLLPMASLKGHQQRLAAIGTRPLGALLFADSSLCRSSLQIVRIPASQSHALTQIRSQQNIWGRRSLFHLGKRPLLISEYFLPALQTETHTTQPLRPRHLSKTGRR